MFTVIPDTSRQPLTSQNLDQLPLNPGVYFFYSNKNKLLYIGKAINLKRRVKSYFSTPTSLDRKTTALIAHIRQFAYQECVNDLAALLLESHLIAQYKPPYNVKQREKSNPIYIAITKELYSRVYMTRRIDQPRNEKYFGPFFSHSKAKYILKALRPIIKFRTCKTMPSAPCLYLQLGLCLAPCQPSNNNSTYSSQTANLESLLSGRYSQLLIQLKQQMYSYSNKQQFEKAAEINQLIQSLSVSRYLSNTNMHLFESDLFKLHQDSNRIFDLNQMLSPHFAGLNLNTDSRLEAYDISHLSAQSVTGSMIVFWGAKADKTAYRRFRLKPSISIPDDSARLYAVLSRRYKHSNWLLPQLILIDGGKPQVSLALRALKQHNLTIPLVGLAKKRETLVIKTRTFKYLSFQPSRPGMLLLRHLRDEAHRFAKNYHLKLRLQSNSVTI